MTARSAIDGSRRARSAGWYCTVRWAYQRIHVLAAAAQTCAGCGQVSAVLDVDHRIPHRGDLELFWDPANLQALCKTCHAAKTNRELGNQATATGTRMITIVTGPPGSGKTTYVQRHRRPGDLVWDYDALADTIAQLPRYPRPPHVTHCLMAIRAAFVEWVRSTPDMMTVFVIITNVEDARDVAARCHGGLVDVREIRHTAESP